METFVKYISVLFFISILYSCEYEKDLFEKLKNEPKFSFMYNGVEVQSIDDSIKIQSSKMQQTAIAFQIRLNDKSRKLNLGIDGINGIGELTVNGNQLKDNQTVQNGSINCEYVPSIEGEHIFDLIVKDEYGKTQRKRIRFFVFHNLPPVADFEIIKIGQNSQFEIEIRAIKSYDTDDKWGGRITTYKYKIGNYYQYETDKFSTIKHILPTSGTYIISLQVKDNDNAYSQTVFKEVKL